MAVQTPQSNGPSFSMVVFGGAPGDGPLGGRRNIVDGVLTLVDRTRRMLGQTSPAARPRLNVCPNCCRTHGTESRYCAACGTPLQTV